MVGVLCCQIFCTLITIAKLISILLFCKYLLIYFSRLLQLGHLLFLVVTGDTINCGCTSVQPYGCIYKRGKGNLATFLAQHT